MQNNRVELAIIQSDEWSVMKQQAEMLVGSGFLPQSVNSPQKALAIMTLGRELGIGAWAALSSINVIQGKPTISPQLMLALINDSKQLEDMTIRDETDTCVVMMKRVGRTPHTAAFSMKDAAAMGLSNKDNWKKQPAIMRQWRAVAACARVVFPDVILGMYTPEEMGANVIADETGNMQIVEVKREEPRQLPHGDEPTVHAEQPSASVSGAGVRKQEPQPPDFPLTDDDAPLQAPRPSGDPNTYHAVALIVSVQRSARNYALRLDNGAVIPLVDATPLVDLLLNETAVPALERGTYPVAWLVTADRGAHGDWDVQRVAEAVQS